MRGWEGRQIKPVKKSEGGRDRGDLVKQIHPAEPQATRNRMGVTDSAPSYLEGRGL